MPRKTTSTAKASKGFCSVTLAELNAKLKPDARVVVSKRYAAMVGLDNAPLKMNKDFLGSVAGSASLDVALQTFDAPKQNKKVPAKKEKVEPVDADAGVRPDVQLQSFAK